MNSEDKTLTTPELNNEAGNVVNNEKEGCELAQPTTVLPETENNAEKKKNYQSKAEVLERIREIVANEEKPEKEEVDYLKTTFYRLHTAERETKLKAYLEQGGEPEKYVVVPDGMEEEFKTQMGVIKERRQKIFLEQEKAKQENLQKKLDIIEKIKNMITSPEEANKSYNVFKTLQQEWKEIKAVPAEKANELWKTYQLYVEQFYDLLKLNSEAREYDFKKNLELKENICVAAEKLADEPDVISAFYQLQELHAQYREIGPVAKELREQIWTRFKTASTVVNKRHQQHFEELRAREEENLNKKTALCEKAETIIQEENKTSSDWEKRTKEIIELQTEWKTIGFAPQKMNVKIFERFRAACDSFFTKKAQYFKETKERFAENLEKRRDLVEKAKALADSTDWKNTTNKLIELQKEWKTAGIVPKKQGDQLWKEFLEACNKFFEARNEATADVRNEERNNLKKKKAIIEQLKELLTNAGEDVKEKLQSLTDAYNEIGHVPFHDKDKIYKQYREVLDKIYTELHVSMSKKRLDDFKNNIKSMAKQGVNALDNERSKLLHRYDSLKQEIQTYENNIGFLTAGSKKGNSLIDEMNRKVQKLKDDFELIKEKIKAIDRQNREQEQDN